MWLSSFVIVQKKKKYIFLQKGACSSFFKTVLASLLLQLKLYMIGLKLYLWNITVLFGILGLCLKNYCLGYEANCIACKEEIEAIINESQSLFAQEISLDASFHPRLIGLKGRNVRKVVTL